MGNLNRQLRLMKSTLRTGLKHDVSDNTTGKLLQQKGYISKSGKTTVKGKKALKLL